jgi:hypothetical protein
VSLRAAIMSEGAMMDVGDRGLAGTGHEKALLQRL